MLRKRIPLALVMTLAAALAARAEAQAPVSPLDSFPARFDYLANNAPFVVFDVAPRTLNGATAAKAFKELTLSFVATDALHRVDVYTGVTSPRGGTQEVKTRIACGSRIAGHQDCAVPTREALLLLNGEEGVFSLRIEAEGVEGERSTVRITLPVRAGGARPAPPKVTSPLPLSLVALPATGF